MITFLSSLVKHKNKSLFVKRIWQFVNKEIKLNEHHTYLSLSPFD